jgi:NitT/TauT family transport system permease protein
MSIAEDRPLPPSGAQPVDAEEARRARSRRVETVRQMGPSRRDHDADHHALGVGRARQRDPAFHPAGPDRVWDSLVNDWGILIDAAYLTGRITLLALILAVVGGAGSPSCSTSRKCWSCRSTPMR